VEMLLFDDLGRILFRGFALFYLAGHCGIHLIDEKPHGSRPVAPRYKALAEKVFNGYASVGFGVAIFYDDGALQA